jgi:hypothetical protein
MHLRLLRKNTVTTKWWSILKMDSNIFTTQDIAVLMQGFSLLESCVAFPLAYIKWL